MSTEEQSHRGSSPDDSRTQVDDTTASSGDSLLVGADSDRDPILSVVMPTLNEEEGVGECIAQAKQAIEELNIPAEIILSDSSTDRTPKIGREMGAIVYEPDAPGYGYAYRYAFERARGEFIVMGDADTTYDFKQIPRLLERLREEDADIVMGSRLNGEIKDGAMPPLHQYVGNPLLTRFLNAFYDAGVSDAHSGFRIFTQDALETMNLETTGMEFASEIIMEAGARDLDIVETPIIYHEREGEETLDSFRDGWRHVRFMLVNAPGYIFSVPGAGLSMLGVVVMLFVLADMPIQGVILGPNSMIVGSLLVMVGYQALSLGVFSTVAGNPIQKPSTGVSAWIGRNLTLERGATVGLILLTAGLGYGVGLFWNWLQSGIVTPSFTVQAIAAFTGIVLGLHTVFSAFFLSMVSEHSM